MSLIYKILFLNFLGGTKILSTLLFVFIGESFEILLSLKEEVESLLFIFVGLGLRFLVSPIEFISKFLLLVVALKVGLLEFSGSSLEFIFFSLGLFF